MQKKTNIKAGLIQFDVRLGDISANLQSAVDGIGRLADKGAELVVLPELWSCGFDTSRICDHAEKTPGLISELSGLAKKHHMMIAGSLPEIHEGCAYNTLYLVGQKGFVSGAYRKIHLFPPLGEPEYFTGGKDAVVCPTPFGDIGMMICYDLRFPELSRSLALKGAQIIVVSAQWPKSRIEHWDVLLQARAIENQVFMIACNRCGKDGGLEFCGHSQIISPSGKIMAMMDDRAGEALAEMDLNDIVTSRKHFDCLKDRVPAAYERKWKFKVP